MKCYMASVDTTMIGGGKYQRQCTLKPTHMLRQQTCWYDYLNQPQFLNSIGHLTYSQLLGSPYLDCSDHLTYIQPSMNALSWILVATQLPLISYQRPILDSSGFIFSEPIPSSLLMAFFNFSSKWKACEKCRPNLNLLILIDPCMWHIYIYIFGW